MEGSREDDEDLEISALSYPQRNALEEYAMKRFETSRGSRSHHPDENESSERKQRILYADAQMLMLLGPNVVPVVIQHLFGSLLKPAQNRTRFLSSCSSSNLEVQLLEIKALQQTCKEFARLDTEIQNSMRVLGNNLKQILAPVLVPINRADHALLFDPPSFLDWVDAFTWAAFRERCVDKTDFWEGLCNEIAREAESGAEHKAFAQQFLRLAMHEPFSMEPFRNHDIFCRKAPEYKVASVILSFIFEK